MLQENPKQLSPLTLAFLGDAVYELCVRKQVIAWGNRPVGQLHSQAVTLVNAKAQSHAFAAIEPMLTEEELAIFKRGRNASAQSTPKHADIAEYRRATGLEALFGYLYLVGEQARIEQLFEALLPVLLSEER